MDSVLGGRRTSAFPVDAPSIFRVRSVHLSRDARLAQPLGQLVDVRLIAKWEPADVRVFRVNFNQFAPDLTRFLGLAQMAKRDGKEGAGEIGFGTKQDALPEQGCSGPVVAGDQVGRAEKMDVQVLDRRIEPDRLLGRASRGQAVR
jgi:hypothetical protein